MKKMKSKSNNYKWIILLCLILIIALVFSTYLIKNNNKVDKAKDDALVIVNAGIRKYIDEKMYNNSSNITIGYNLSELDVRGNTLKCPFNNKTYSQDSQVNIDYDQNSHDFTINAVLFCDDYSIKYYCNTKKDMIKHDCKLYVTKE